MAAPRLAGATADDLCAAARAATGLDDFGPDTLHEGLHALMASCEADARLSDIGQFVLKMQIDGMLANRLRFIDWAKQHPEVRDERITAPIVVIGMPRTGTTLLSFLLEQDPFNRSLYVWEAHDIVPPPELETWRGTDPRIAKAMEREAMTSAEIKAMHPMPSAGPTECVVLLAADFRSLLFETLAYLPGYSEWLAQCDYQPAYDLHRLQLQILQSRIPVERWALKTPNHLWCLDTVLATYPDARIIWTHRDPVKTVGSVTSLVSTMQRPLTTDPRPEAAGQLWIGKFRDALDRAAAARADLAARGGASQIADIDFRAFVADPVGQVRRAYEQFGLELSDLAARRMQAWVDQNPSDKHGVHRYDIADFGIDPADLRARFADYTATYAVTPE